mgnify:FL=1
MVLGAICLPMFGCQKGSSGPESAESSPDQVGEVVEIAVIDFSGMEYPDGRFPVLYMATDRGGWDPAGLASVGEISLQAADPEGPHSAWTFLVPREWLEGEGVEAKFTRGDWSTVEVDAVGRDIANRRFTLGMVEPHTNIIGVDLMGFADQHRGAGGGRASTVVGTLETFAYHSEVLGRGRTIRVWLPRGYGEGANADRSYPVMYMHDGQNLFDAATSFIGVEWGVDETLTELIAAGEVPAMIVVGIDNAGVYRASEYNPEGTEFGGVQNRGDLYLRFVLEELMPEVEHRYRTLRGPEHTGMGGSSFGGNATLYAAMRAPGVFGRILVESPASWIGDNALVSNVDITVSGMSAPTASDCNDRQMLLAQIGDIRIDASLTLANSPVTFTAYITVQLNLELGATDEGIGINITGVDNMYTELTADDASIELEPTLIGVLEGQLAGLLGGLGDGLGGFDLPEFDLSETVGLPPGSAVLSIKIDDVTRLDGTTVVSGSF